MPRIEVDTFQHSIKHGLDYEKAVSCAEVSVIGKKKKVISKENNFVNITSFDFIFCSGDV